MPRTADWNLHTLDLQYDIERRRFRRNFQSGEQIRKAVLPTAEAERVMRAVFDNRWRVNVK
jgi:hypothetical protein